MNCEICFTQWDSPCGKLMLASSGNKLVMNDWLEGWHHEVIMKRFNRLLNAPSWKEKTTPVISQAINQLEAYFHGQPNSFNLDIDLIGTEFQLNVWHALQTIPYGKLVSYKDIAQSIGHIDSICFADSGSQLTGIGTPIPDMLPYQSSRIVQAVNIAHINLSVARLHYHIVAAYFPQLQTLLYLIHRIFRISFLRKSIRQSTILS